MEAHEKLWLTEGGAIMVASLGVSSGQSVIDFGCGIGRYTIPLAQAVGNNGAVLAVERNEDDVAELRRRMELLGGGDAITINKSLNVALSPVPDGSVDHVLIFDVLQYIDDWGCLFARIRRVLKKGGFVHVYPAAVPHPGDVDMERVQMVMADSGLHKIETRIFHMMHNRFMENDKVHTFIG